MELSAVKSKIQSTDCARLVRDGVYCSEPILTKDSNGQLIDNYFLYSRSADFKYTQPPKLLFGIYSDLGTTAYVKEVASSLFDKASYEESFVSAELMESAYERYVELYPTIRANAFLSTSEEMQPIVSEYLESLKAISGDALYSFYITLYPSFFKWAEV